MLTQVKLQHSITIIITQAQIEKLNDYYLHTDKGLAPESCARANNGVTVGATLLREWKYSAHTSGETGHRHMSHLMALYPMEQITPEIAMSSHRISKPTTTRKAVSPKKVQTAPVEVAGKSELDAMIDDFTIEKAVIYSEILEPKFKQY